MSFTSLDTETVNIHKGVHVSAFKEKGHIGKLVIYLIALKQKKANHEIRMLLLN